MTLPFKPHILALICSAGLLAASGTLYVKSRAADTPPQPAPVAQPATPAQAPVAPPTTAGAQQVAATYTPAQIDQWVAPVALYPDNLLSQVLMASTYPSNVVQAVQWSQDNPSMQGDAAVQAVANQPWDPSVKSLVAFPALLSLMGENPQWVQDLGNAFLAQPQDVMDSVQKLRNIAQQTGTLKSGPQQKVTTTAVAAPPPAPTASSTTSTSSTSTTTTTTSPAPTTQVIKIESTDPNVVYVPTYNPNTVYGTWPNTSYPPVYLPPTPGSQFTNSFVNGFGYSLGVATTYALFSSIDWDHDDYHHHDDDYYHGGGGYHGGSNNNINVNVNNFNHITGQHLNGNNANWQHNPTFRNNVPYPNNNVSERFHQTNVAGGLSATQHTGANRDGQRQAALNQFQHSTHNGAAPGLIAGGAAAGGIAAAGSRDSQRQAASKQLNQIAQRNNYRGYDGTAAKQKLQNPTADQQQRRDNAKSHLKNPTADQQQRRENAKSHVQNPTAQQQQRREQVQQHHASVTPAQKSQRQQKVQSARANALSGNDSRSPNWEAQRQRGVQSQKLSGLSSSQRSSVQHHVQQNGSHHIERRHR
ncbi:DUF3300 domain-containing protein [Enterobacteriaceae bacterium RIT691]|nr:DUF3300 domain-containing protein [Enterobacteriaceae bacterium RIT691]